METQNLQLVSMPHDYRANVVDTSRAFSSVKEAVAVFGERLILGEFFSPSPSPKTLQLLPSYTNKEMVTSSPSNKEIVTYSPGNKASALHSEQNTHVLDSLKRLEAELEETKTELKLLKEKESETEVALANLNAELHKNMSKLAQAEANAAAKAAASSSGHLAITSMRSNVDEKEEDRNVVKKDSWSSSIRVEDSSTSLAQILSISAQHEKEYGYYGSREKRSNKMMKKKPIVPLPQDLFSWRKGSSTPLHDHIYSSPKFYY